MSAHDFSNHFIIKKLLAGVQRSRKAPDVRLPITYDILIKLIDTLDHVLPSHYQCTMFRAMFLLAFSALLRIGEICPYTMKDFNNVLQVKDCEFKSTKKGVKSVVITIRNFKHNVGKRPFIISIPGNRTSKFCLVESLKDYLKLRGLQPGPLFAFGKNIPVTRQVFSSNLKLCLTWLGLDTKLFKGHSFRIGAASFLASRKFTDSEIQRIGRWNSDAFRRYIRIPEFTTSM